MNPGMSITKQALGAVRNLGDRFANQFSQLQRDRSDRMIDRQNMLQQRAGMLQEIGDDRAANKLFRKANIIGAKLPGVQQAETSRETAKDYRNQVAQHKAANRSMYGATRAGNRMSAAQLRNEMSNENLNDELANRTFNIQQRGNRDLERIEGRLTRDRNRGKEDMKRDMSKQDMKNVRTGLRQPFLNARAAQNQMLQTEGRIKRDDNREVRAAKRYNS